VACCVDTMLVARLFLRSASRRPRRWPAFRRLGCRKPAFPACSDAPSSHSSQPPPVLPYCLPVCAGGCEATLPLRCALPACCTPLLAAAEAQTLPSATAALPHPASAPLAPCCSLVKSSKRPCKLPAGVASACRAASLFLTIARLVGGAAKRLEIRLCCRSLARGRCPWGADAGTGRVGDRCFVSVSNADLTSALGSSHTPLLVGLNSDTYELSGFYLTT
jgi:hypothetical protein